MTSAAAFYTRLRLCVVCDHTSLAEVADDARLDALFAAVPTALIELRLDGYADLNPKRLRALIAQLGPKRILVTFRTQAEGGFGRAPQACDRSRADAFATAQAAGVLAIDIEVTSLARCPTLHALWRKGPSLRVASWHCLTDVPPLAALQRVRAQAEGLGAQVVKIVVAPADLAASEPLLALLERPSAGKIALIGLATGAAGLWSRLLAGRFAQTAPWTYACLPGASPAAPGQLAWPALCAPYDVCAVDAQTPVFGVIGAPVLHSASPALHTGWLRQHGRSGIYLPWHLADGLAAFLQNMAPRLGVVGLSVTHPCKADAYNAATCTTSVGRATGAINTLWRPSTSCCHAGAHTDVVAWHGDNTDAGAAAASLQALAAGCLTNVCVLILGAGGAARAVAYAARAQGAQVRVWARDKDKAKRFAEAMHAIAIDQDAIARMTGPGTIVVNCTPVGMQATQAQLPMPIDAFAVGTRFFDTIYAPSNTAFLRAAQAQGAATLNGMPMLVHQARAQHRRFMARPCLACHDSAATL